MPWIGCDAVSRESSCNLIHLETMLKVDLFIRRSRPFEEAAFERSARRPLDPAPGAREFDLTTAEDIVLHKLEWFRAGGASRSGNGGTRSACWRSSAT